MTSMLSTTPITGFSGDLIDPGHPDYDAARRVFNGLIDKRPAQLLRCRSVADICSGLRHAIATESEIAVRGGGHSVAGHSVSDGGTVIDLSQMRDVHVDPVRRIALVQGGATWRDIDRATAPHQLACPGGVVSTTGVGGFGLGGGVGWLARSCGLTCDNIIGAQLVLASGDVLYVGEDEHPEVLWALRGGGGNFGVVPQFVLRLHPIDRVFGGIASYRATDAQRVLAHYAQVMDDAEDDLACILDFASPEGQPEQTFVTMIACHIRPHEAGERSVRALLEVPGLTPVGGLARAFRYATWQQALDHTAPFGRLNYWKSVFLTELSDQATGTLAGLGRDRPSPHTRAHLIRLGGAASRVSPADAAFAPRHHPYIVHLITAWEDQCDSHRCQAWTDAAYQRLRPYAPPSAYLNFIGDEGQERVRATFGDVAYRRLAELKLRLDPDNRFSLNQNILPATGERRA
jgi:FAD/FMN-containing dehydrogenase